MTNAGAWTPAPRGGLVPLHPYGFGTILGKSFAVLRGNPKVLLGFVVGLQLATGVLMSVAVAAVAFWAASRLDTVPYGTQEYRELEAGIPLYVGGTAVVLGLLTAAVSIIAQAVVVGDAAASALGEKATLGRIWARVRGRIWALVGYALLMIAAIGVIAVVVAVIVIGMIAVEAPVALGVIALVIGIPGSIVLYFWLYTKLYVVTPAIVLERAGVFQAIGRSWRLTTGRFWPTFGVYILLSLILSTASAVVVYPLMFLGMLGGAVFAPTGGVEGGVVATIATTGLSAIASFLVQCITSIVMSTSAVLVYLDARMRREGIDLKMQRYIEARDLGYGALTDPYAYDPGDVAPPRPPYGYGQPGYPTPAPYGAPAGHYATQGTYGAPGAYGAPYGTQSAPYGPRAGAAPSAPPAPAAPAVPAAPPAPAAPAPYAAPYGAPARPPYAPPAGGAERQEPPAP